MTFVTNNKIDIKNKRKGFDYLTFTHLINNQRAGNICLSHHGVGLLLTNKITSHLGRHFEEKKLSKVIVFFYFFRNLFGDFFEYVFAFYYLILIKIKWLVEELKRKMI